MDCGYLDKCECLVDVSKINRLNQVKEEFEQEKPPRERKLSKREQQMTKPMFNSNYEKYEWFMAHGCTNPDDRKWLADYIRTDK